MPVIVYETEMPDDFIVICEMRPYRLVQMSLTHNVVEIEPITDAIDINSITMSIEEFGKIINEQK